MPQQKKKVIKFSDSAHPLFKEKTTKKLLPLKSGIGDFLKEIIKESGNSIPCGECQEDIESLNRMTAKEVEADIKPLCDRILGRAAKKASRLHQRLVAAYAPELIRPMVEGWIRKACDQWRDAKSKPTMRWQYGITTVLKRKDILFPRTLESLRSAGFTHPRIFVDGCSPSVAHEVYGSYNLPITIRENVRTAGHWVLSLLELYVSDPHAERYSIFQDDFVTIKNLIRYLELIPYPEKGYQNLYTFPEYSALVSESHLGWFRTTQRGLGAVALVFSNEAVRVLFGQDYLIERFQDKSRGHRVIDGGIVDAMKKKGWSEYCHSPSLVQHTGIVSSMKNPLHPLARDFPGEDFNAMKFLEG